MLTAEQRAVSLNRPIKVETMPGIETFSALLYQ
jgi:hypothetical protein